MAQINVYTRKTQEAGGDTLNNHFDATGPGLIAAAHYRAELDRDLRRGYGHLYLGSWIEVDGVKLDETMLQYAMHQDDGTPGIKRRCNALVDRILGGHYADDLAAMNAAREDNTGIPAEMLMTRIWG